MTHSLNDQDQLAVDLILDRGFLKNSAMNNSGISSSFSAPGRDNVEIRVGVVESLLRIVSLMPAADPSPDLTRRTLQRIEAARTTSVANTHEAQTVTDHGQASAPA
jgi:hypothetical protein